MEGATGELVEAGRGLLAAARQVLRQPLPWLGLLLVWAAFTFALGLIPVMGAPVLTLVGPLLWGGILKRVPGYRAGEQPGPADLLAALRPVELRSRLLGVGGLVLAFHLLALALSMILALFPIYLLPAPDPEPLVGNLSLIHLVLALAITPVFLLAIWFYLAVFLGLPRIIFEGRKVIPAVRGGGRIALGHLALLFPVPLVMAATIFGEGWIWWLVGFLPLPFLILFQYRIYEHLSPRPDSPDPEPKG